MRSLPWLYGPPPKPRSPLSQPLYRTYACHTRICHNKAKAADPLTARCSWMTSIHRRRRRFIERRKAWEAVSPPLRVFQPACDMSENQRDSRTERNTNCIHTLPTRSSKFGQSSAIDVIPNAQRLSIADTATARPTKGTANSQQVQLRTSTSADPEYSFKRCYPYEGIWGDLFFTLGFAKTLS